MTSTQKFILVVLALMLSLAVSARPAEGSIAEVTQLAGNLKPAQGHDWASIDLYFSNIRCNGRNVQAPASPVSTNTGCISTDGYNSFRVQGAWLGFKIWKDQYCLQLANIARVIDEYGHPTDCYQVMDKEARGVSYSS